jgi:hypothetical protein
MADETPPLPPPDPVEDLGGWDRPAAAAPTWKGTETHCPICAAPVVMIRKRNGEPLALDAELLHASPKGSGRKVLLYDMRLGWRRGYLSPCGGILGRRIHRSHDDRERP